MPPLGKEQKTTTTTKVQTTAKKYTPANLEQKGVSKNVAKGNNVLDKSGKKKDPDALKSVNGCDIVIYSPVTSQNIKAAFAGGDSAKWQVLEKVTWSLKNNFPIDAYDWFKRTYKIEPPADMRNGVISQDYGASNRTMMIYGHELTSKPGILKRVLLGVIQLPEKTKKEIHADFFGLINYGDGESSADDGTRAKYRSYIDETLMEALKTFTKQPGEKVESKNLKKSETIYEAAQEGTEIMEEFIEAYKEAKHEMEVLLEQKKIKEGSNSEYILKKRVEEQKDGNFKEVTHKIKKEDIKYDPDTVFIPKQK
ncbi:MAG TPA: hypothetical protein VK766_05500 [Cytophagaceae bacterium]|jgi:hypothetical protein|nr:hypothetical protein [Cytophagaceae bacterium]